MKLIHYSDVPLLEVRSIDQVDYSDMPQFMAAAVSIVVKPDGLWLSAEDGKEGAQTWPEFLGSIKRKPGRLRYDVQLATGANVLRMTNAADLDAFTERFAVGDKDEMLRGLFTDIDPRGINWPKVAAEYQGIVIAPFVWSRRMRLRWYYAWDCASGCIWDAAAIEAVSEVLDAPVAGRGPDPV